jgi:YD repeat-containing protein
MKTNILKQLLYTLTITLFIASCSEDEQSTKCVLLKFGLGHPNSHWVLELNGNGTVASATSVFTGTENERYDYSYSSDKISIFLTDLSGSKQLACVIGLDGDGRPVSRTEYGKLYETLIYDGNRLDHAMWSTNDSLVYRYNSKSDNPTALDFYSYHASTKSWTLSNSTAFTYDEKINPLKGLIVPTTHWNTDAFLSENNLTSYSSNGETWNLTYTYNTHGYPVSRTLTSSVHDFSETVDFEYKCE